jgi:hypothetical protein
VQPRFKVRDLGAQRVGGPACLFGFLNFPVSRCLTRPRRIALRI